MASVVRDFGNQADIALGQALKEWAIAIQALHSGDLILLLRKGGLRDKEQPFRDIPYHTALFPTYEHQVPQHLKNPIEILLPAADAPIHLETWAQITHRFALTRPEEIAALMPFHIWSNAFMVERLKWRQQQPIQALLLRAYRLPKPVELGQSPSHNGCRSWIDLDTPIPTQGSIPALSEQDYQNRLQSLEIALRAVNHNVNLASFALP